MAVIIKISPQDELKVIKSNAHRLGLSKQIHKNKKAYSRLSKYKKLAQ